MTHHLDHNRHRELDAQARRAQEIQTALFKRALQEALGNANVRSILWEFMQQMGFDASPFSGNGPAMAREVGKHDAVRWWLAAIREHCPEREAQIRTEGVARDKQARNESMTEDSVE